MRSRLIALTAAALISFTSAARAQSVVVGDATFVLAGASTTTRSLPASEWKQFSGMGKTNRLIAFAGSELKTSFRADPNSAFTTTAVLRAARGFSSIYGEFPNRITVVPLVPITPSSKFPRGSAALMLTDFLATPDLRYPRLLLRYDGTKDWMIEEFSDRLDGRVTKMTAKFGDCLIRSVLAILSQQRGAVYRSLDATLRGHANEPVATSLRRILDVNAYPVGQGDFLLYEGLMIISNLEEEFGSGYISGTLSTAFKPSRNDGWLQTQIKQLGESIFKDLVKQLGKALWSVLLGWLGF